MVPLGDLTFSLVGERETGDAGHTGLRVLSQPLHKVFNEQTVKEKAHFWGNSGSPEVSAASFPISLTSSGFVAVIGVCVWYVFMYMCCAGT